MTVKELTALAKACRKAGIIHYKVGDIELKFDLAHASPSTPQEAEPSVPEEPQYGEEDALFWSSAGISE